MPEDVRIKYNDRNYHVNPNASPLSRNFLNVLTTVEMYTCLRRIACVTSVKSSVSKQTRRILLGNVVLNVERKQPLDIIILKKWTT